MINENRASNNNNNVKQFGKPFLSNTLVRVQRKYMQKNIQNPMLYIDFGQLPVLGYKAFSQSFASKTSSLNENLIQPAAEHSPFSLRSSASSLQDRPNAQVKKNIP